MLTWSSWSHVALVLPDGIHAVEATWPRVRLTTVAQIRHAHRKTTMADLPCLYPDLAGAWALAQVGLPYDWGALVGMLLERDWTEPWSWFCSELVAAAFEEGGSPLFRKSAIYRVTPGMVWMLPED